MRVIGSYFITAGTKLIVLCRSISRNIKEMDDQQFSQLLDFFGLSWRGYRKVRKGVKKRISRHMNDLGCRSMAAYLIELTTNEGTRKRFECLMTVSISRFFRDRKLWQTLQGNILPKYIEKPQEKIIVWIAGCGSGEEVYSLRIILEELKRNNKKLPPMEITATDLNPQYLKRAKVGVYSSSSLKELPEHLISRYFHKQINKKIYSTISLIKDAIDWQNHDLLNHPPKDGFDIIFLRNNLLTYYDYRIQVSALRKVLNSLSENGFLIIGSHEKLPVENMEFLSTTSLPYLFRKT